MREDIHSSERRLALYLSPGIAAGVTVDLEAKLSFKVTLFANNIDMCVLSLDYDPNLFENLTKEIKIEFTQKVEQRDMDIVLTPISRTDKPAWVGVMAAAGSLIQVGGFFVTVV